MIYKTYKAPTYKEAVLNAKMELGNNCYIIGRKQVKEGGFLGLFTRNMTKITVAKNEQKDQNMNAGTQQKKDKTDNKSAEQGYGAEHGRQSSQDIENVVMKELNDIKTRLRQLMPVSGSDQENPYLKKLVDILRENDFSNDYVDNVIHKFENELTLKDIHDPETLESKLKSHISESIETAGPVQAGKQRPSVVVLVGPTGVGKTTTVAKLAASFGVLQKHKVELLTIDSYRIAAIEQLGKYAELMQLPFTIINSREEFKAAVSNSKSELIFVDTAGRSQKNNMGLAELRSILDGINTDCLDIHLVISATTKHRDALDIMTRFNQLMYNKVILTKMDETNTIGSLLSVLDRNKKLSYFTTGQSVPDDIEIAQKEKLLNMLILN
ncbi:MAG: flagellar biosynthesis protein FlhF [Spirochaetota bacterium]